jgi:poly(A) polymerase
MADRLSIVSVERIHDELERLLAVDDPGRGFGFLGRTGLLVQVVPALAGRVEAQIEAIALASGPGSILARRAGLLAPLGAEAAACLRRLRYDRSTAKATMSLLQVLDTVVGPAGGVDPGPVGDGTVRQVIDLVGFDRVDDLRRLAHNLARYRAAQRPEPCGDPGDDGGQDGDLPFFERVDELAGREDLSSFTSPLSGRQVMAHLGVEPGPLVGDAVDHLRQQRLSDGPLSAEAAYELLDEWWRQLPGAGDSTPGTAADGN